MVARLSLLVVAALVSLLGAAGCRSKRAPSSSAPVWQVGSVEAQERSAPGERIAGVDATALRAWMLERLRRAPGVRLEESGAAPAGGYRVSLELGVGEKGDEDGETPGRVVLASLRGTPGTADGAELRASTVKPLPRGQGGEGSRIRAIVEGLLDDLLFQARLAVGPPRLVADALRARKDVARLAAAVEIAGVRRVHECVPALIELLHHKDDQISDRAIGALVAIGDRAAVKPLTRLSSFRDTARMAKVLDAIGTLGGQEAKDYLEFVATGHEDADIRNLAAEALERMNRASAGR